MDGRRENRMRLVGTGLLVGGLAITLTGLRGHPWAGLLGAAFGATGAFLFVYGRGRRSGAEASSRRSVEPIDVVDEAGRESFPASDPPAFTPGHA